ncbi:PREDICTED: phosphatidylinositol 4-phosphate 3-kinase C2 domain-containing subunit beta isoform X3 [Gavialis gangeticus]|uniref:phosphatidylinositol 4-phosphate 3-kinase C2 domain-containing subunit beta isoform X1 n=1 Tax=Gavialis gangeticus TaxID=94835 RepID=UPI00092E8A74|nr:PREDICTED: phosphatidylinositol 4-phosphate 3-kinase C2 domain-containing subunit beta isoform X1 [Gavialis gangeticus]XP_019369482.1 PREDICTED: phosphatidylinositol 4-phosphate 3-kinase C2 domain-containing subunit beta isoform X3 [Gavialis gangeticus]
MSATRGNGEHWKSLESVGISRKELALAEALQMEYDALSRLRQDKEESQAKQNTDRPLISWDGPDLDYNKPSVRNDCNSIKIMRGLSGSDPTLNYNSLAVQGSSRPLGTHNTTSSSPLPKPDSQPWLKGPLSSDYLYIFESSEGDFLPEPLNGTSHHDGSGSSPKKLSPPPLPPRISIWSSSEVNHSSFKGSPPSYKGSQPNDINMFSSAHEQADRKLLGRRISEEDPYGLVDYDGINDAITCLNLKSTYDAALLREATWGWKEGRSFFEKETTGKPVARSKTMPPQVPPRTYVSRFGNRKNVTPNKNRRISVDPVASCPHSLANGYELFEVSEERDEEVAAFCHMLDVLRSGYSIKDYSLTGYVWSAVNFSPEHLGHGISLKVTVVYDSLQEPLTFTCDCSSTVDLLIYQTLCYTHDELHDIDVDNFVLKLCGLEEFLQNKHALGSHEYIQHCRKFDVDIRLQLMKRKAVRSDLARTVNDDQSPSTLNHYIHLQERPIKQTISRQALSLLFDTFHNEVDTFLAAEGDVQPKAERVIQSVMAICNALAAVESQEITRALNQMPPCPSRMQPKIQKDPNVLAVRENREKIVETLTASILDLVELYCNTFNADFQTAVHGSRKHYLVQEACLLPCPLSFTVYATHRIPITWAASYEDFYLSCSLSHGGKELCSPLQTRKAHVYKYLFHLIIWDQQICFPIQVNRLPRETLLSVTLYAVPVPPPGSSSETNKQRRVPEALGWVTTPLFNFRQVLTCGRKLLGLWPATQDNSRARSSAPNFNQPDSVILQIDFPTSAFDVRFMSPPAAEFSPKYEFGSLGDEEQRRLREVMQKKSLYWLTDADRKRLWEKRYYCHTEPGSLPLLLASAPSWEWACLPDIYALLKQWTYMNHQDALGLLHATFPDQEVRRTAVQWIDSISDAELLDYLPQLVQALKYECYLDSPLVRFLMKRAICDLKITHYFFWLLKDGLKDSQFSIRYQYLLAALLCCCGKGLREEFDRQCALVNTLAKLAQQIREAAPSSRQAILREGLEDVKQFFNINGSCRLPLSPSLLVKGIVPRDCSYFNSNAVPLKLSFQNVDPLGENIRVIFKCGDDLRQDMLTLQMIRIMNKIWVQEGLDMRMVIFRCFSTGRGRGMVEMIPNAETLRKIQVEHGVTGSFKDRPLADWLQKHNPKEDEYEKAVENFIYSCAGCCVATYVLGICDRHNDNIMLKTTGHMFHIDFGRFLGHAQMFGNIKRDRAPFVFTSDMAYVINGGDKPSSRFHDFVDLCCQAYNLIRKHTHLFLNLLGLMLSCGIPELSDLEDLKYVYDALRPQDSEADATTYFTRLIESSLGSVATKLNFFIHNLAQMKFTGSDARPTLSFAPRTHTLKASGRIRDIFLCRHEKVFNPSKGYMYVVQVQRESPHEVAYIQRTFEEFQELHNKLRLLFPSSQLPSFPSRFVIGRSRGEAAAERRKEELNGYIWHLIHSAPEVTECDLVYTFFHPLPRDEKAAGTSPAPKPADATWARPIGKVGGEVKLSISYKNNKLFIMVMHIRGLQPIQDGNDPDPYVKIYLLPDPQKTTKRKTKVARKTCNPTYNEMLVYDGIPKGDLQQRELRLSVLSEEGFWENILLGEVSIKLRDLDLTQEKMGWFALGSRSHGTM